MDDEGFGILNIVEGRGCSAFVFCKEKVLKNGGLGEGTSRVKNRAKSAT